MIAKSHLMVKLAIGTSMPKNGCIIDSHCYITDLARKATSIKKAAVKIAVITSVHGL